MSDDLQTRVEQWLREQGYPLEMRVARGFQRRGWFLHQSRRYKDPILGKEREIDLLAFYDDPDKRIHGHFVVECKWTPGKPWVLFAASPQTLTSIGYFRSTPMTIGAEAATESVYAEDVQGFPLFFGIEEGYGLVQAFSKDAAIDAAYSAVQTAVNAANFFASDLEGHSIAYVPTVILDGALFRCSLAENGDVSVRQIDIGCVVHQSPDFSRCVHIVRESALDEFIDRSEATFKSLRTILKDRRG